MSEFGIEEVLEAIGGVSNLNAVLKKILKHEVQRGSQEERFFKDFRRIANAPRATEQLKTFISNHFPDSGRYSMVVAGYAYDDKMSAITAEIIEKYADEFNSTYETKDSAIEIKDRAKFNSIAKEAIKIIEEGIKSQGLPASTFMKKVIVHRLFTPEVAKEVGDL